MYSVESFMLDKEKLILIVNNAFMSVSYPVDDDLTVHPLGFDEQFYESIKEKRWKDLGSQFLMINYDCIGLLTPKGFQYYLPAFLITDINNGTAIFNHLLNCMLDTGVEDSSPIKSISGAQWYFERMSLLSVEQKKCLIEYFNFNILYYNDLLDEEILNINKVIDKLEESIEKEQKGSGF